MSEHATIAIYLNGEAIHIGWCGWSPHGYLLQKCCRLARRLDGCEKPQEALTLIGYLTAEEQEEELSRARRVCHDVEEHSDFPATIDLTRRLIYVKDVSERREWRPRVIRDGKGYEALWERGEGWPEDVRFSFDAIPFTEERYLVHRSELLRPASEGLLAESLPGQISGKRARRMSPMRDSYLRNLPGYGFDRYVSNIKSECEWLWANEDIGLMFNHAGLSLEIGDIHDPVVRDHGAWEWLMADAAAIRGGGLPGDMPPEGLAADTPCWLQSRRGDAAGPDHRRAAVRLMDAMGWCLEGMEPMPDPDRDPCAEVANASEAKPPLRSIRITSPVIDDGGLSLERLPLGKDFTLHLANGAVAHLAIEKTIMASWYEDPDKTTVRLLDWFDIPSFGAGYLARGWVEGYTLPEDERPWPHVLVLTAQDGSVAGLVTDLSGEREQSVMEEHPLWAEYRRHEARRHATVWCHYAKMAAGLLAEEDTTGHLCPYRDLGLSERCANELIYEGFTSVADLMGKSEKDLRRIYVIGDEAVEQLKLGLARLGLSHVVDWSKQAEGGGWDDDLDDVRVGLLESIDDALDGLSDPITLDSEDGEST